ncbi:MAG: SRPBCC domain-containing protein [Candidatus Zixiibacteriota bacterium]|nr:MAG: SRPBCC domain-containing protein [candidate division Zixibacteria bacterium]
MADNMTSVEELTGRALVITRTLDAPPDRVYQAWTDPDMAKQWYGPQTFTVPEIQMDPRPGGSYLFCMRSPDGQDYWSTGTYREIVPGKKIVSTDSFADEQGNVVPASYYGMVGDYPLEMLTTVTFEEVNGKTRMTLRHEGIPEGEDRELARQGWEESFDKLNEFLKT